MCRTEVGKVSIDHCFTVCAGGETSEGINHYAKSKSCTICDMYMSVPPEDYTTCGSAVWLRSTLMTFWFPVVNTFSRNTPIMSDVNAVSIFQDSTLPPSDSSHSVNNSPTSWKPRIALLSNITYPIFNIKIDDFACLMVTRICK